MKNQKGFTLIELLAVIVILGVLLAIAVPAVTKYTSSSRKSTYVSNMQQYVSSVRLSVTANEYTLPVSTNQATVVSFDAIAPSLDKGGEMSPYDGAWTTSSGNANAEYCYVVIVNEGTAEVPAYKYYIAAIDDKGYGLGTVSGEDVYSIIAEKSLGKDNILQIETTDATSIEDITVGSTLTIDSVSKTVDVAAVITE